MKYKLILAFIFILCVMTSCSYPQTSIDNLLSPPKLSEEQHQIDTALKNKIGNNISLIYPKKGDYKSAFVIENLDEETTSEALVFYKETASGLSNTTSSVRITVLDQYENEWVCVFDETSINANEVEKLSFIKQDNKTYVVIGFNVSGTNDKTLSVYEYSNSVLNLIYTTNCVDYEIYDLDEDDREEIILLVNNVLSETQTQTTAKMLTISNSNVSILSETKMDDLVTRYVAIYKGKVNDGRNALYFDVQKTTDTYTTEILTAPNGNLTNLSLSNNKTVLLNSSRLSGLYSTDLNNDGIFEIPNNVIIAGYSDASLYAKLNFINWFNYTDGDLYKVTSTYTDYPLGYSFYLPENWINKDGSITNITATVDSSNNEISFSLYNPDTLQTSLKILSLKVFIRSSLSGNELPYGYNEILSNGQLIYAYQLFKTGTDFDLEPLTIIENFQLMN